MAFIALNIWKGIEKKIDNFSFVAAFIDFVLKHFNQLKKRNKTEH
jgi:hypothetical protein